MRVILFAIKEAFSNLFINLGQTFITIIIMFLSIITLMIFATIGMNIDYLINNLSKRIEITVYVNDDADLNAIQSELEKIKEVKEIRFKSKAEALEDFKKKLESKASLIDILEENPLPASFHLELYNEYKNLESMENISKKLELIQGINDIQYGKDIIKKYENIVSFIYILLLSIGIFLLFVMIVIVSSSIKLTVASREESIEIMSLIGATNGTIRSIFFFEGIFKTTLAFIISLFTFDILTKVISQIIPLEVFLTAKNYFYLYIILFIVGGIGSLFSINKALRMGNE